MGRLKVMRPRPRLISQAELRSFVALQNSLRLIQRFYDQRSGELLAALLAGGEVESGTHIAEVVSRAHGPKLERRLLVR